MLDTLSLIVALPVNDARALIDKLAKMLEDARSESCDVELAVFDVDDVSEAQLVVERVRAEDGDSVRAVDVVPDREGKPVADTVAVAELLENLLLLPDKQAVALLLGALCVAEKCALGDVQPESVALLQPLSVAVTDALSEDDELLHAMVLALGVV